MFPIIDEYCIEKGYNFQPIDLRWGINKEAQLDQKTLKICLNKVKACKHFHDSNFLIMEGDRYGYVPLPYTIEESEFHNISQYLEQNNKQITVKYN